MGHAFWQAVGTPAYFPQLLNFLKNTSMTGGLLFIAATSTVKTFRLVIGIICTEN
jgi:hypothetical protein